MSPKELAKERTYLFLLLLIALALPHLIHIYTIAGPVVLSVVRLVNEFLIPFSGLI